MNSTQKVNNISSQLPIYCDKGTDNLVHDANIFCNTTYVLFFKYIFLYELLKFSNP